MPGAARELGSVPRGDCLELSLPAGRYGLRLPPGLEFSDGASWTALELGAGGREERSFQEPASCSARLLIVDEVTGAAVRGAQVGLERPGRLMGLVSDPLGRVDITHVPCGAPVVGSVYTLTGSHTPVTFSAETGNSDIPLSVVRLSSRDCQRTLQAIDSEGRPLSGVEAVLNSGMTVLGTSDDEGWLRFSGCESPTATFFVRGPGRALVQVGPTEGLGGPAWIELPEPAVFELRSTGDGAVQSVEVEVGAGWRDCEPSGEDFSCSHEGDGASRVVVGCLDAAGGDHWVVVVVPQNEERVEVACPSVTESLTPAGVEGLVVEGRVIDEGSRPVPGVSVGVLGGVGRAYTLSDLDGSFALSVSARPEARLLVTATWGPERWASRLWSRGEEGDFVLELPEAPSCDYLWVREVGDRSMVAIVGWQNPAWEAGIRPGDVVTRVGGIDTAGLGTSAVDALLNLRGGTTTVVGVLGPGGGLDAELACPAGLGSTRSPQ